MTGWLDTKITIPAIVAILTFVVLHFIIDPWKAKKKWKEERFKNLYAPLYTIIISRLGAAGLLNAVSKGKRIYFGSAGEEGKINNDYMIEFTLKNSAYASNDLLNAIHDYTYFISSTRSIIKSVSDKEERTQREADDLKEASRKREEYTKRLVITFVKEYNQLKKDLDMDYNKVELETGIPEFLKDLFEKGSDKGFESQK
ncbi:MULTISPECIES: hypothetical protein [unclassified Bacillus (in: firmicutes)]|uniref:hypothetical protein n=1 Tax=unclassified Bacillus (in: firmicutes) TaxID=185979 RepID=UPI000E35DC6D|nr:MULTISPECIES: hypothetical protein [unclassified Bacillus (in: firmicutes)]AXR16974.1 hypothetical protein DOS87_12965 [Bacillus sp. CR71]AXR22669.1 hypothetical protein DPQ26_12730 [Bacillus sp. E25]